MCKDSSGFMRTLLGSGLAAALVLPSLLATAGPLGGQLVDQGVFRLFVDDAEVGTEEFAIQRSGSGDAQVTLAKGTITMRDGRTVTTLLRVQGSDLALNDYQAIMSGTEERAVRLARVGDRLQARTTAPWGEELREYRAQASTLLLDQGVAHHYFVLAPFLDGRGADRLHTVAPLPETEETIRGIAVAPETIQVDQETIQATRIRLGSGDGVRIAWFDGSGRLVRVALPGIGFLADRVRDS